MQNSVLKFLSILFLLSFTQIGTAWCQSDSTELSQADALFQQKRYIQSFELYQSIFGKHQYTPSMLLKMAYIKEGLNQIAQSEYYLNLYYLTTLDEAALGKMNDVADKYRLEGYARSEADAVWMLYQQHYSKITMSISALLVFLFTLVLVIRFRLSSRPYVAWTFFFLFSMLLLVHLNVGYGTSMGIISKNNTYLMSGPSAGSSVVSIVRDGHRVEIKGKKDVWLKVQWGDQEVYIKETSVLPVAL